MWYEEVIYREYSMGFVDLLGDECAFKAGVWVKILNNGFKGV